MKEIKNKYKRGFNLLALLLVLLFSACHSTKDVVIQKENFASASIFQLLPPKVLTDSVLFRRNTSVDLAMEFPDAEIRYTLDGSPVTQSASLYEDVLIIEKTTQLQALAFHPDCNTSEVKTQLFYKVADVFSQSKIRLVPPADSRYAAKGVASLTDMKKGSIQFRGKGRWLGFQKDTVEIKVQFSEKTTLESIILSTLASEIEWIFVPRRVELLEGEEVFAFINKDSMQNASETGAHFMAIDFPERKLKDLTIRVLSDPLPKGHNGYGFMSWFFVDEIIAL
ncbi:MAG: hexosaminidase [Polaribacter sp.]|jgi:hexosaminidase